jgi:hypothetical protein
MLRFYAFLFAILIFNPNAIAMGKAKLKLLTKAEIQATRQNFEKQRAELNSRITSFNDQIKSNQDALKASNQEKTNLIREHNAYRSLWGTYVTTPEIFLKGLEHMGRFERRNIHHCKNRIVDLQEQLAILDAEEKDWQLSWIQE